MIREIGARAQLKEPVSCTRKFQAWSQPLRALSHCWLWNWWPQCHRVPSSSTTVPGLRVEPSGLLSRLSLGAVSLLPDFCLQSQNRQINVGYSRKCILGVCLKSHYYAIVLSQDVPCYLDIIRQTSFTWIKHFEFHPIFHLRNIALFSDTQTQPLKLFFSLRRR